MKTMIKRKIVWQADAFDLIAPSAAGAVRIPAGFVFDPHEPFILASRVYPEGLGEPACLAAAVEEAMFTYGVIPSEVHVRIGKEKDLMALAKKKGFTVGLYDELPELAAVKEDMAKYLRRGFADATAA